MTARPSSPSDGDAGQRERYLHGSDADEQRRLEQRTGESAAGFFLPHLRPGLRLLDVGCGPGSITLDLAAAVAPGEAFGIDFQERQVARARELAAARAVANARFEVGDAYALPFPDASFDAVFAHAVLSHLRDPRRALREVRRVLRPSGVVGVADYLGETHVIEPYTPLMERGMALAQRVWEHGAGRAGGELGARHYRRLALEAGFARAEAIATARGWGAPEATRRRAAEVDTMLHQPGFTEALNQGWVDRETLEAIAAAYREWGERPDAVWVQAGMAVVGWKG